LVMPGEKEGGEERGEKGRMDIYTCRVIDRNSSIPMKSRYPLTRIGNASVGYKFSK